MKVAALERKERKVIGFLVAKGLLVDPTIEPLPGAKLDVRDVLEVAEHIEPRVLEVFPAALLKFPRTFTKIEKLPSELREIVHAIRCGERRDTVYRGIRYADMLRWAEKRLPDRRTKPISEKRILRAFRLRPETVQSLIKSAKSANRSQAELIDALVSSYL